MRLREEISPDQCRAYEQIALGVVHKTVSEYGNQIRKPVAERRIDTNTWKLAKTRDNIKIYKATDPLQNRISVDAVPGAQALQWAPATSLLCIGSLVGSLEDAMYGAATPTEFDMATRSLLIQDEFIEHRVLKDIRLPTVEKPFQYVGLKWALRRSRLASIVKPRDVVYVEASGYLNMPRRGGFERIGYTVCHSVNVPGFTSTNPKGPVRAYWTMCSIFRQKPRGIIDVYIILSSDPGGNLPPKIAAASAAGALIAASGVMECSLSKKLAWLLARRDASMPQGAHFHTVELQSSEMGCTQCSRKLSSFSSLQFCRVCRSSVCSRCVTTRKIIFGNQPSNLLPTTVLVCTGCTNKAHRGVKASRIVIEAMEVESCESHESDLEDPEWDTRSTASSDMIEPLNSATSPIVANDEELDKEDQLTPNHASLEDILGLRESGELGNLEAELFQPIRLKEDPRQRLLRRMTQMRVRAEQSFDETVRQSEVLQADARITIGRSTSVSGQGVWL